jgi:hypothetical protein
VLAAVEICDCCDGFQLRQHSASPFITQTRVQSIPVDASPRCDRCGGTGQLCAPSPHTASPTLEQREQQCRDDEKTNHTEHAQEQLPPCHILIGYKRTKRPFCTALDAHIRRGRRAEAAKGANRTRASTPRSATRRREALTRARNLRRHPRDGSASRNPTCGASGLLCSRASEVQRAVVDTRFELLRVPRQLDSSAAANDIAPALGAERRYSELPTSGGNGRWRFHPRYPTVARSDEAPQRVRDPFAIEPIAGRPSRSRYHAFSCNEVGERSVRECIFSHGLESRAKIA